MSAGSESMISTSDSAMPFSSRAASRLKCAVDAKGVAIFLPLRSAKVLIVSLFTTSASASPMTSWIHGTWYSMPVERPRETGLEPARPKSTLPPMMASLTEPPESNCFHSISVSGRASSSQPSYFTTRSALGISW